VNPLVFDVPEWADYMCRMSAVECFPDIEPLLSSIRLTASPLAGGRLFLLQVPALTLALWRLRRQHAASIAKLRAMFLACDKECADPVCLSKVHDLAATVLSGLYAMPPLIPKPFWAAPIRRLTESMIIEWEDLSEDCAIASDPDIRALLNQVSEAL